MGEDIPPDQTFDEELRETNQVLRFVSRRKTKDDFWNDTNSWQHKEQESNLHLIQVLAAYYEKQAQYFCNFGRGPTIFTNLDTNERRRLKNGRKDFVEQHFDRLSSVRCSSEECNFENYYKSFTRSERRYGCVILTKDLEQMLVIVPKYIPVNGVKREPGIKYSFPKGKVKNSYPNSCEHRKPEYEDRERALAAALRETEEETGIKTSAILAHSMLPEDKIEHTTVDHYWTEVGLYVIVVDHCKHDDLKPNVTDVERQEVDAASWKYVGELTSGEPLQRKTIYGDTINMNLSGLIKKAWTGVQRIVTNNRYKLHKGLPDIRDRPYNYDQYQSSSSESEDDSPGSSSPSSPKRRRLPDREFPEHYGT